MTYSSDEILSFSTQLAFAMTLAWGKSWTSREIDGCFYNHLLNPKIKQALNNIRRRHRGKEEPPWPGRFDDPNLPEEVFQAAMGIGPARTIVEELDLTYMAEQFGVDIRFFKTSYLTGTPVPFCRYAAKAHTDTIGTPIYRLDIFSRNVVNTDWEKISQNYNNWLIDLGSEEKQTWLEGIVGRGEPGRLQDIRGLVINQGVPHIEVLSYPPFASSKLFVVSAKEHFDRERDSLTGRGTASAAIRAWTAYLLNVLVGLNSRQAILKTNDALSQQFGLYTMNDALEGAEDHTGGVTSSGESYFSGEKKDLQERINNYDSWISQADPTWSFIN